MNTSSCRLEVRSIAEFGAASGLADDIRGMLGGEQTKGLMSVETVDLYMFDTCLDQAQRLDLVVAIVDSHTQVAVWADENQPTCDNNSNAQSTAQATAKSRAQADPQFAEIALRAGVTDPVGEALTKVSAALGNFGVQARFGRRFEFNAGVSEAVAISVTHSVLHNDIVDEVCFNSRIIPNFVDSQPDFRVETVAVRDLSTPQLQDLSNSRSMALDTQELLAIQEFYSSIGREPTDAELETIAQTWSEHCSHKTFRAQISWDCGESVRPLLQQLRRCTDEIAADWVVSAFVDNAGIISFDGIHDLAIKVETHNHPSAIEPFGGANTGVGGVIRDVLGVAADPIMLTNILCFGPADLSIDQLPAGVLHPARIRQGVVAGIGDYGNKIGLATVAGAVSHAPGFTANPLVFAGCVGLRPTGLKLQGPSPGDRIVAIGGATGRDGIRGATFSSATMDATTGEVAGASVQIGDPIVERLIMEVLRQARAESLFVGITDCGAGGFSSAIGEIAAELGADVDLSLAPRKYPGLAPWEMWLSEAQERMVLACPSDRVARLSALCSQAGIYCTDVGVFRSDGQLVVRVDGLQIVDLPGKFLHDGRPQRNMTAARPKSTVGCDERVVGDLNALLLKVASHPDVRSNEDIVRSFDHEIGGATVVRPYLGAHNDGPADGTVIAPILEKRDGIGDAGIVIGIGMNTRSGVHNAYSMATAAVDEAVRNAIAVGANPSRIALLDNFSWGDPRNPETLGSLVEAVAGCCDSSSWFRAPFVSGKDSLNNEYVDTDSQRRSIPPTLVITALAQMEDVAKVVTSDAKRAGNILVLSGCPISETLRFMRASVVDAVLGIDGPGEVPAGDCDSANRYRAIHDSILEGLIVSAHDVSDGGLALAVCEMAFGGRLGAEVSFDGPGPALPLLFNEAAGRLLLEVEESNVANVCARTSGLVIGRFLHGEQVSFSVGGRTALNVGLKEFGEAWQGHFRNGDAPDASALPKETAADDRG